MMNVNTRVGSAGAAVEEFIAVGILGDTV